MVEPPIVLISFGAQFHGISPGVKLYSMMPPSMIDPEKLLIRLLRAVALILMLFLKCGNKRL